MSPLCGPVAHENLGCQKAESLNERSVDGKASADDGLPEMDVEPELVEPQDVYLLQSVVRRVVVTKGFLTSVGFGVISEGHAEDISHHSTFKPGISMYRSIPDRRQ